VFDECNQPEQLNLTARLPNEHATHSQPTVIFLLYLLPPKIKPPFGRSANLAPKDPPGG
jgi:hypothetical protein